MPGRPFLQCHSLTPGQRLTQQSGPEGSGTSPSCPPPTRESAVDVEPESRGLTLKAARGVFTTRYKSSFTSPLVLSPGRQTAQTVFPNHILLGLSSCLPNSGNLSPQVRTPGGRMFADQMKAPAPLFQRVTSLSLARSGMSLSTGQTSLYTGKTQTTTMMYINS